jgi:hypothetical protein
MNLRRTAIAVVFCLAAAAAAQKAPAKPAAPDYSGRYSFLRDGEDIQLNQTGGKVDGYVTRFGDGDSDQGTMLQHTFKTAKLDGNNLTFTTNPVHAVYYEFKGTIERGPAKTKGDDGYYQMVGTLTEYTQQGKDVTAKSRQVTFKLFADEDDEPKK